MKNSSRVRLLAIGAVFILALLIALPFKMLRTDDLLGKYTPSPSDALAKQVTAAAMLGQEASFSESMVNNFIAYHQKDIDSYLSDAKFIPKQIYLNFKDENVVAAYTPVTWRGKHLGVTSESTVLYRPEEKQLEITVQKVKLGRLSVPVDMVLDRAFSEELPQGVTRDGNVIRLDTTQWLESPEAVQYGVSLLSLQVKEGKLSLHAKTDREQVGSQIKQELQDWIDKNWTGDLDTALDQVQQYLKNSGILPK